MITTLRLQQFRSYQDNTFEFTAGVNIIAGPNASGKTNILEALLVNAVGKSYRAKDQELIKDGKDWARVDTQGSDGHTRTVKVQNNNGLTRKSFVVEGKAFKRFNSKHHQAAVLFEPNHLLMLSGPPDLRRAFLDGLIEQTDPDYTNTLSAYKRTLLQRNKLLKSKQLGVVQQLFVWDIRLSELGAKIVSARHQTIHAINQSVSDTYNQFTSRPKNIKASYSNDVEAAIYASYLLKKLEKDQALDLLRGYTGAGPHREDILFTINEAPLAAVASRGEARTLLLALKTIELRVAESARGQKPLLLLDDVFSELDKERRQILTTLIKPYQSFVTTTDAELVIQNVKSYSTTLTT